MERLQQYAAQARDEPRDTLAEREGREIRGPGELGPDDTRPEW